MLVFGATGSAGGSVLRLCLQEPIVSQVRAIVRRPVALNDPKLQQIEHRDFLNYTTVGDAFADIDACLFCLGVSATQVSDEREYRVITRDYAVAAAAMLQRRSPAAAFHFISGMGTKPDSRLMWSRVKAEAESALMKDVGAVCWRPAFIDGEASATGAWYHGVLRHVFRLFRPFRTWYVSGPDLGRAMLQGTQKGFRRRIIENREIRSLAEQWAATHSNRSPAIT